MDGMLPFWQIKITREGDKDLNSFKFLLGLAEVNFFTDEGNGDGMSDVIKGL